MTAGSRSRSSRRRPPPPAKLLRALSTRPAEILGLPGGTLAPGAPADLILFDPDEPYVLDKQDLRSLSKNSPFDEARLQGRVHVALVRGKIVYDARRKGLSG